MGAYLSQPIISVLSLLKTWLTPPARIFVFGSDNAGKTTMFQILCPNDAVGAPHHTNIGEVSLVNTNIIFTLVDIPSVPLRSNRHWRDYLPVRHDGLIFVVDSADTEGMMEAKRQLHKILNFPERCRIPLLVIANKQDLPGSERPDQVARSLGLHHVHDCDWHIVSASCVTRAGATELLETMEELARIILDFRAKASI